MQTKSNPNTGAQGDAGSQPLVLTREQIIHDFFNSFTAEDAKDYLDFIMLAYMESEQCETTVKTYRGSVFFCYLEILKLLSKLEKTDK